MTRKDYQLIASSLSDTREDMDRVYADSEYHGGAERRAARTAIMTAAKQLAVSLSFDNPRFDTARFLRVVRGESER